MKFQSIFKCAMVVLSVFTLTACESIPFINDESDYKSSGRAKPLEVPPDLTAARTSDAYRVPGSTTYSDYSQGQDANEPGVEKVLATPGNVRMEKAGGQRWLVVKAPAEKIWPIVREFWLDQGFAVRVEDAQIGLIETEWVRSNDIKVKNDSRSFGERFDRWLDGLSDLADRRKFRTRLERGEKEGTTEIYMTHRTVRGAPDDGKNRVQTQLGEIETGYRRDARTSDKSIKRDEFDADLDAELLRRLMVKLGIEEKRADTITANAAKAKRAELVEAADKKSISVKLNNGYARSWRRVGLALDRIGFVIEDKDRSNGLYFVRYADVDIDIDKKDKKKGLWDILWGDDEKEEEVTRQEKSITEKLKFWKAEDITKDPTKKYRILVSPEGDDSASVSVVNQDGTRNTTGVANHIISLLYDQLR